MIDLIRKSALKPISDLIRKFALLAWKTMNNTTSSEYSYSVKNNECIVFVRFDLKNICQE